MILPSFFKTPEKRYASQLFDETNFYEQFLKDVAACESEEIIESPFITSNRMEVLLPVFQRILDKGKKVQIITRDPAEHEVEDYSIKQQIVELWLGIDREKRKTTFHLHRCHQAFLNTIFTSKGIPVAFTGGC